MFKAIKEYGEKKSEETRLDTIFHDMKNIMESLDLTLEQAMSAMKVSDDDRAVLAKRF